MTPDKTWPGRFWVKVDKTDGCWLWTGCMTKPAGKNGYGQIRLDGRMQVAHRIAYELLVGPIPDGLDLDHLCRTRLCVNPAHLEPVTPYENLRRGESPAARHMRKTHCNRGHELAGDNLCIVNGGKSRRCKRCKRDNERARRNRAVPDGITSRAS